MSTPGKVLLATAVVVMALAGGGLFWFLRDDAPAEVSLDAATATLAPEASEADDDDPAAPAAGSVDGDVTGTWEVDTGTGEFDYERATGTFAGFRIEEELANVGSTTAVGRTGDVGGTVTIDGPTVTDARISIDLTTLTTNESRRDDKVQEALDTEQHPTATFTLTEPIDLGTAATSGEPVATTATGELTIHGVTRAIEMALEAQLVSDTIVVVGSNEVTFSDYEVEVPSSPIVLSVEDHGTIELQLLLTRT